MTGAPTWQMCSKTLLLSMDNVSRKPGPGDGIALKKQMKEKEKIEGSWMINSTICTNLAT